MDVVTLFLMSYTTNIINHLDKPFNKIMNKFDF